MALGLTYRMDPLRVLELAEQDPSLVQTMIDVAEELG